MVVNTNFFTRSRRRYTITIDARSLFFATALAPVVATDPAAIAAGATNFNNRYKISLYYRIY